MTGLEDLVIATTSVLAADGAVIPITSAGDMLPTALVAAKPGRTTE